MPGGAGAGAPAATTLPLPRSGTGTGAIALALAGERPDCSAIGVDVQPEAVALAQHNAHKLKIDNVRFLQGSWFAPVAGNASR